ncbi:MAG: FAD-dependent oxidoreductase [Sedimentisphaerales bacterium]
MAFVQTQTRADSKAPLSEEVISQFKRSLRGDLIQTSDPEYDKARTVYNAMIDKHPAMIARCRDIADVMACVDFARENEVPIAVRGGGHSGPGLSLCDDGLVIDLSLMKGVRVDSARRMVRVGAGCTWGDIDHATHAFGLAVPGGVISTTGVGGLTLGGGHGYLARKYGLTIDNLLEADVVLSDGRLVTASPKENADLFWAIRGGGGNFGIVTSFLFKAHPVDTVYGGPTLWPLEKAGDLMKWYRDFTRESPRDLYGFFAFLIVPPAPPFPERCRTRRFRASSTRSIRRACNGILRATSLTSSVMKRYASIWSTPRRCRHFFRAYTFTPSTVPYTIPALSERRGITATRGGPW